MIERCGECRFYRGSTIGECCRRAPTPSYLNKEDWDNGEPGVYERVFAWWPVVEAASWCGEYEAKQ